jgi:hypothetical protein
MADLTAHHAPVTSQRSLRRRSSSGKVKNDAPHHSAPDYPEDGSRTRTSNQLRPRATSDGNGA